MLWLRRNARVMLAAFAVVTWLGLTAAASGDGGPGVVDVTDPASVAWAGLGAVGIVGFLLRVADGLAWVHKHPVPAALVTSLVGAFVFGRNVLTEWRTLLGQGILVAMGAVGTNAIGMRAEARADVDRAVTISNGSART